MGSSSSHAKKTHQNVLNRSKRKKQKRKEDLVNEDHIRIDLNNNSGRDKENDSESLEDNLDPNNEMETGDENEGSFAFINAKGEVIYIDDNSDSDNDYRDDKST